MENQTQYFYEAINQARELWVTITQEDVPDELSSYTGTLNDMVEITDVFAIMGRRLLRRGKIISFAALLKLQEKLLMEYHITLDALSPLYSATPEEDRLLESISSADTIGDMYDTLTPAQG